MENIDFNTIETIGGAIALIFGAYFFFKKFKQRKSYYGGESNSNKDQSNNSGVSESLENLASNFGFDKVQKEKLSINIDIDIDKFKSDLTEDLHYMEDMRLDFLKKKSGLFKRAWLRTSAVIFIFLASFVVFSAIADGFDFTIFIGTLAMVLLGSLPFAAFLALFYYLFKSGSYYNKYQDFFKKDFLPRVLKHVNETLEFSSQGMSKEQFLSIGIFKKFSGMSYSSEDTLKGKVGSTDVIFSEVQLQRRETRGSGENKSTSYVKIFKGMVLEADFNKNLNGKTFMVPDFKDESDTSSGILMKGASFLFGKKISGEITSFKDDHERVSIEDGDFEKYFNVYSTDQIESRFIFSPTFIELVKFFKDKLNKIVYLAFHGSKMYLLIDWNQNMFEAPNLKVEVKDAQFLIPIIQEVHFALSFVEDFNLNQRIWNK
jgi:hypothetical protein